MSNNQNNNIPAQPVYIMTPQPQQPQNNDILGGLGGIVLSTIAVILAFMGLSKLNAFANAHSLEQSARLTLRKPGVLAVGMCVFALIFNIISLIVLYPIVMQSLQSGDLSGLFGAGQGGAPSPGAGSSTWG